MNTASSASCVRGYCATSKILSRIKPHAPIIAVMMARIDKPFCTQLVLWANRPVCRSHRSAIIARSSVTTIVVEPAMNSGRNLYAPTSDIYLFTKGISSRTCNSKESQRVRTQCVDRHGKQYNKEIQRQPSILSWRPACLRRLSSYAWQVF